MNYKKLMANRFTGMSHRPVDTSTAVIGLLAGLAVGAVLGVLFAPDSGKRTRERISDKALDLTDNIKDGYHSVRERMSTGKEELTHLKDRVVDNVKNKAAAVSQEFKEFKETERQKSKSAAQDSAYDPDNALQDI
jgi:gas vesicle protein